MDHRAETHVDGDKRGATDGESWLSEALFLVTYGVMIAGLAVAVLDTTGITTLAGSKAGTGGAIYTSIYIAIMLFTLALAVPYTPKLAARFGMQRTFFGSIVLASILWGFAGILILSGAPAVTVLLIGAIGFGVASGVFAALIPLYSRAYIEGRGMAGAYARLSVAGGIAWALGSGAGGVVLVHLQPGWGLVIRAGLGIPLAVFVAIKRPKVQPTALASASAGAWGQMRANLVSNRDLRRAALLGCGVAMFAAPLASMIVPIAEALRQTPLIPGAGVLMAAMAVGEILAPVIVTSLERGRTNLHAAALASVGAAISIAIYGLTAFVFSKREELVAWAIIGVGFGALKYGARALNLGAATDAGSDESSSEMVATFVFVSSIAAPVGVLAWGLLINQVSVEAALFAGATGTILVASRLLMRSETP
jgi:CP family cyanate transporter-like MFS transporter